MENKVIGADPNIVKDPKTGLFYAVASGDDETNRYHFPIYESSDLKNWKFIGYALDKQDENNWARDWFWAPECYYNPHNGYFYLFYSAKVNYELLEEYFNCNDYDECCKIGVAVSKSIKGPFKNITNRPLNYCPYDPEYLNVDRKYDNIFDINNPYSDRNEAPKGEYLSMIDVNMFIDEDEKMYLFYSRCCYRNVIWDDKYNRFVEESNICAVELESEWWKSKVPVMPVINKEYINIKDGRHFDKFKSIITYHNDPQEWENGHINDYQSSNGKLRNRRWSEGSTTFVKYFNNEKYYCLTYSANNYENALYGVGIAFSKNPLGPYKKYAKNPIISKTNNPDFCSLGHGCYINESGQEYYFHHGRKYVNEIRSLFISTLDFKSLDDIKVGKAVQVELIK